MNTTIRKLGFLLLPALFTAMSVPYASATPPDNSAYVTDPQNQYVQDATADGIATLNNVLCIVGAMNMADMVNTGNYIALVDKNKCNKQNQASPSNSASDSSSGAAVTADYMNATVNVARASSGAPMIGKAWMSTTDGLGRNTDVYAYLSATRSPADVPPYGVFRVDYIGKATVNNVLTTTFNGYIDSQSGQLNFFERTAVNGGFSDAALALTAASTSAGAGSMSVSAPASHFDFAYDGSYFRRSNGIADQCFDRATDNVSRSVWRYGTYNATTGARADIANPGFPIKATVSGTDYMGFAGYYGINFQGVNLNSLADGHPVSGVTITDQRPGNSSSYSLNKLGGKLTKWTKASRTLDAMDGIPFNIGFNFSQVTFPGATPAALAVGFNNWVMVWNKGGNPHAYFIVTGTQDCSGANGCVVADLAGGPVDLPTSAFKDQPISGFSNSFGGNLNIPFTGSNHAGADAVNIYTQSAVFPGDTGLTLYCLSQCPTTGSIGTDTTANTFKKSPKMANGTGYSYFGNNTGQQFFFAAPDPNNTPPNTVRKVSYTFDAGGLKHNGVSMAVNDSKYFPTGTMWPNGVMTGRLFVDSFAPCTGNKFPADSVCEPGSPDYYYTWQTGPNQWTQSMWLTSGAGVVPLDPPSTVAYTVPGGAAYGSYAGKNIQLQFNGFGNLFGIPGYCVNPVDNSAADCKTANVRYVPSFALPDGATMGTLIVKALDAEVRLKSSAAGRCTGLTLTSKTLPLISGLRDPSAVGNDSYLGSKPNVSAVPKVIDGVIQ